MVMADPSDLGHGKKLGPNVYIPFLSQENMDIIKGNLSRSKFEINWTKLAENLKFLGWQSASDKCDDFCISVLPSL